MKCIQKGQMDDKIVSQLLQVHQTFLVTFEFLSTASRHANISTMTNQTIRFGKYINLLSALIYKK
jgi:hypothetical protein